MIQIFPHDMVAKDKMMDPEIVKQQEEAMEKDEANQLVAEIKRIVDERVEGSEQALLTFGIPKMAAAALMMEGAIITLEKMADREK